MRRILAGLKTGEDAVAFFATRGATQFRSVKFVSCNPVRVDDLPLHDQFRPYDLVVTESARAHSYT